MQKYKGPPYGSAKKEALAQRVARLRVLSDAITTRALYTPLVYVFSRRWSMTSTAVRFHLRVLLCRPEYKLAGAVLVHTPDVHRLQHRE